MSGQTGCIVKGEAQKSPLFRRYPGRFWFSQDRLFSRNSTRKPLNLKKTPIFTNSPKACKSTCLYNAPSLHTNLRFSAKICVLGFLCHLRSVTLSAPWPIVPKPFKTRVFSQTVGKNEAPQFCKSPPPRRSGPLCKAIWHITPTPLSSFLALAFLSLRFFFGSLFFSPFFSRKPLFF